MSAIYLMQILKILSEAGVPRIQAIEIESFDAIIGWLEQHAPTALHQVLSNHAAPIYRGTRTNYGITIHQDTMASERKSNNSKNYVTLLSTNLPSWQGMPPRSKGVSCTTDLSTAMGYAGGSGGTVYVVFPGSDTKVMYTGAIDFWYSLKNLEPMGLDVPEFIWSLDQLIDTMRMYTTSIPSNPTTYADMVKVCEAVDHLIESDQRSMNALSKHPLVDQYMDQDNFDTFLDFLDHLLDPKPYGTLFTGELQTKGASDHQEVFISGDIYCVELSVWKDIVRERGK